MDDSTPPRASQPRTDQSASAAPQSASPPSASPHSDQAQWARLFVDALRAGGVEEFVVSPGSRSTPFLLAAIASGARIHNVLDERAAAFFALGLARVRESVPALLCTSGSAAGHYLPAVMEAAAAGVPLLVISADRPAELHGSGANQTVDQQRLFGEHVRHFVDLGTAEGSIAALRGLVRRTTQAVSATRYPMPGPVHINAPARKPLDGQCAEPLPVHATQVTFPRSLADDAGLKRVQEMLDSAARPAIVAGPAPLSARQLRGVASELARRLGAPLLADQTSQLDGVPFLSEFDPDLVLQIGRPPIDSAWEAWADGRRRAVLSDFGWPDPSQNAELLVMGDVANALERLTAAVDERSAWAATQQERVRRALRSVEAGALGHASLARCFADAVPASGLLMAGNSLAIRHLDLFARAQDSGVLHQRGLSGIDGLVAGAAGAATAGQPVGLLLGDLSLMHDLTSLALAPKDVPLVIAVANDRGGRIFERLPVNGAVDAQVFESHFAMGHEFDFGKAADTFSCRFARPADLAELQRTLSKAFETPGCTLVEVALDPGSAQKTAQLLRAALAGAG